MRVIAGTARGRKLQEPEGRDIRPTLDRVRAALFNMLMPEIEGAEFLDLYSGTGANGIEALSRGAAYCVFVDSDAASQRLIRDNLFHTGLARQARCLAYALPADLPKITGSYDIIFADPPYAEADYPALIQGIVRQGLLKEDGALVIEHHRKAQLPDQVDGLERTRHKQYGDVALSVFRHAAG